MRGEGGVAVGDLGVPLRSQVPDRGRVFDQEGHPSVLSEPQESGGVGSDQIPHPCVETVVHVGEDDLQPRLLHPEGLEFGDPLLLQLGGQLHPILQKLS